MLPMLDQTDKLSRSASEILGDLTALAEQLGGADGLFQLPCGAACLAERDVNSPAALGAFLKDYVSTVLLPWDLPAVSRGYYHTTRYEARELIAFDRSLHDQSALGGFADSSRRVGRMQLVRLRPLRGERLLQRYSAAVEEGEAYGWHSVVFGVVLALYSFPLRQGLAHFGQQTVNGFVQAARNSIPLTHAQSQELLAGQAGAILQAIESIVGESALKA